MLTRRSVLLASASIAAGVNMSNRTVLAKAAQPATPGQAEKLHEADSPMRPMQVHVTCVDPIGKSDPGGGAQVKLWSPQGSVHDAT